MIFDNKAPQSVDIVLFNKPYTLDVKYIPTKNFNMITPFHIRALKNFISNSKEISHSIMVTVLYSILKDPITLNWLKVPKDLWGEDMDIEEYLEPKISEVIIPKELHIYPYIDQTVKIGCDTNHMSICKKGTTFIYYKDEILNSRLISANPNEIEVTDAGIQFVKGKRSFY